MDGGARGPWRERVRCAWGAHAGNTTSSAAGSRTGQFDGTPTLDTDLAAVADAAGLEQAALQVAATTRTHPAARSHAPLGWAAAVVGAAVGGFGAELHAGSVGPAFVEFSRRGPGRRR